MAASETGTMQLVEPAEYAANPGKFSGRPSLPRYTNTANGRNELTYTAQAIRKTSFEQDSVLVPSGLDTRVQTQCRSFDMVRIVPRKTHYVVEVVYTVSLDPPLDPARVAAGDPGVDTLCALTSNQPGFIPLLVNGRAIKSINQRYNKQRAALQSRLPKGTFTSGQLDALGKWKPARGTVRIDGKLYKFVQHSPLFGTVKTLTVKRDPVGRLWLVCCVAERLVIEEEVSTGNNQPTKTQFLRGIPVGGGFDFGLKTFLVDVAHVG